MATAHEMSVETATTTPLQSHISNSFMSPTSISPASSEADECYFQIHREMSAVVECPTSPPPPGRVGVEHAPHIEASELRELPNLPGAPNEATPFSDNASNKATSSPSPIFDPAFDLTSISSHNSTTSQIFDHLVSPTTLPPRVSTQQLLVPILNTTTSTGYDQKASQIVALQTELHQAHSAEVLTLQTQITTLTTQLTARTETVSTLQQQLDRSRTALAKAAITRSTLSTTIGNRNTRIDELEGQVTSFNAELVTRTAKVNKLTADNAALTTEMSRLEGQVTTLRDEVVTLTAQNTTLTTTNTTIEGYVRGVKRQLERLREQHVKTARSQEEASEIWEEIEMPGDVLAGPVEGGARKRKRGM